MYSGSSGVDPVLREMLRAARYYFTPFGPEGTARLAGEVVGRHAPFYHWTHDPVETFAGLIGQPDYKFIFLHRDPRDVAVSWAHDFQHQNICPGLSLRELMHMVITHNLPPNASAVCQWLTQPCLIVRFDDFKQDPYAFFNRIVAYLGFDPFTGHPLHNGQMIPSSATKLNEIIDRHRFDKVAGRERGQDGAIIRNGYMLRKGISGEWRVALDDELISMAKQYLGPAIVALGYEQSDNW